MDFKASGVLDYVVVPQHKIRRSVPTL